MGSIRGVAFRSAPCRPRISAERVGRDRNGNEAEDEDQQRRSGDQDPGGSETIPFLQRRRMPEPQNGEEDSKGHKMVPADGEADDDERGRAEAGNGPVDTGGERVQDMPAVELPQRHQIQGGGEKPDPAGDVDRVEINRGAPAATEEQADEDFGQEASPEGDRIRARRLTGDRGQGESQQEDRNGDDESGDRPRNPHIEKRPACREGGAYPDDGPEGPEREGGRNEERQGRLDAVQAAGDVMPHLVRAEYQEDAQAVRKAEAPVGGAREDIAQ